MAIQSLKIIRIKIPIPELVLKDLGDDKNYIIL